MSENFEGNDQEKKGFSYGGDAGYKDLLKEYSTSSDPARNRAENPEPDPYGETRYIPNDPEFYENNAGGGNYGGNNGGGGNYGGNNYGGNNYSGNNYSGSNYGGNNYSGNNYGGNNGGGNNYSGNNGGGGNYGGNNYRGGSYDRRPSPYSDAAPQPESGQDDGSKEAVPVKYLIIAAIGLVVILLLIISLLVVSMNRRKDKADTLLAAQTTVQTETEESISETESLSETETESESESESESETETEKKTTTTVVTTEKKKKTTTTTVTTKKTTVTTEKKKKTTTTEKAPEPEIKHIGNTAASISSVYATSTLNDEHLSSGEIHSYTPIKMFDGFDSTCWAEGVSGYGEGESVTIELDDFYVISGIDILNGLATSEELFYKNGRVKDITVEFSGGEIYTFSLTDGYEFRKTTLELPEEVETSRVTITINSVYEGNTYTDTCISELSFY